MVTNPEAGPALQLPEAVLQVVERTCGSLLTIEPLGGLSGSDVVRIRAESDSVVVKGGGRAAEAEFYRSVAPGLGARAVSVPALHWAGRVGGRWWLVLEDVPHPLPRERWGADDELLTMLARLHGGEPLPRLRARDAYRPAWPVRATTRVLATFPAHEAAHLSPILDAMRLAANHLFVPEHPLSGDANPCNWGVRADGTAVLFDWERFCRGSPAIDLATMLPGLGTPDEYTGLARRYLVAVTSPMSRGETERLARDIGLAKAWTVVEFLAGAAERGLEDEPTTIWLHSVFPGWVRSMHWLL